MARDFDGLTDRIDYANTWDPAGTDLTWSAWIYPNSNTVLQYIDLVAKSGDDWGAIFQLDGAIETGSLRLTRRDTGAGARSKHRFGSGNIGTGSWHHVLFTDDATYDDAGMEGYVNGAIPGSVGTSGSGTTEGTFSGQQSTGGRILDDNRNFNGRICEVATWNRILDADEIAALAKRYAPSFFMRGLQTYRPLIRDPDDRGPTGQTATLDGTAVIEHPPMIYPG